VLDQQHAITDEPKTGVFQEPAAAEDEGRPASSESGYSAVNFGALLILQQAAVKLDWGSSTGFSALLARLLDGLAVIDHVRRLHHLGELSGKFGELVQN
jgi:hypothetical protein